MYTNQVQENAIDANIFASKLKMYKNKRPAQNYNNLNGIVNRIQCFFFFFFLHF